MVTELLLVVPVAPPLDVPPPEPEAFARVVWPPHPTWSPQSKSAPSIEEDLEIAFIGQSR